MFSHKYSAAQKIRACEDYLSGKYNSYDACERNGIHYKKETRSDSALRQWVAKYKLRGASAFSDDHLTTKSYSSINGRKYIVSPEKSFGYADKNWGRDFTSPWVWLSSNCLKSRKTGEILTNSAFDIGGGRPKIYFVALDRRLLGVF